jgi:hypothetical protein
MALGSTQSLTEMSTRNLPGGKKRPARRADNLTAICEPNVCKLWEPQPLATLRATTACTGIALPFTFTRVRQCCGIQSGYKLLTGRRTENALERHVSHSPLFDYQSPTVSDIAGSY